MSENVEHSGVSAGPIRGGKVARVESFAERAKALETAGLEE